MCLLSGRETASHIPQASDLPICPLRIREREENWRETVGLRKRGSSRAVASTSTGRGLRVPSGLSEPCRTWLTLRPVADTPCQRAAHSMRRPHQQEALDGILVMGVGRAEEIELG